MRIVVVEDEPAIADFLVRGLGAAGYEVALATDGEAGERLILDGEADLVVLDRMLPGRDGLDVLASIRKVRPLLPVIILSAKDEVEDRIAGLDSGATDYVTKPFSVPELLARIRAHLRTGAAEGGRLRAGDVEVDLMSRRVWRSGKRSPSPPRVRTARLLRPAPRAGSLAGPAALGGLGLRPRPGDERRRRLRRLPAAQARRPLPDRDGSVRWISVAGGREGVSLRSRLTIAIGGLILVSIAALGIAVYNIVGSQLNGRTDDELASPGRWARAGDPGSAPRRRGGGGSPVHRQPGVVRLPAAHRPGAGDSAADQQPVHAARPRAFRLGRGRRARTVRGGRDRAHSTPRPARCGRGVHDDEARGSATCAC